MIDEMNFNLLHAKNAMTTLDAKTWRQARLALENAVQLHLDDPNVSHIDLGYRIRTTEGNRIENELAVRVHVHRKLYGTAFARFAERHPNCVIDAKRIGFAVDVPQTSFELNEVEHCLHAGMVLDLQTKMEMLLTSRSALVGALSATRGNNRRPSQGRSDDRQYSRVEYIRDAMSVHLDAALARIHGNRFSNKFSEWTSSISGSAIPQLGMKVIALDRNGEFVSGIITGILGSGLHRFDGAPRLVRHAVHITPEISEMENSMLGNSGSWWLTRAPDGSHRAIGLHFACSACSPFMLALSMPEVLSALDVDIIAEKFSARSMQSGDNETNTHRQIGNAHEVAIVDDEQILPRETLMSNFGTLITEKLHGKLARTVLIVLFFLASVSFCYRQMISLKDQDKRLVSLQQALPDMRATTPIDSLRRYSLRKIVSIIDGYNQAMKLQYKQTIAEEVYRMSLKYPKLDVDLICATITHESGRSWNPRAVSSAGAMGLMQIMPSTGIELAREEGIDWKSAEDILFDPVMNIRLGCRYLSLLVNNYDIDGGLAAYNGGQTRAARWVRNGRAEGILHEETAYYVPAIMKIYELYRRMSI